MSTFPDVPEGHYSEEAIEELVKRGLLKGHDDGTFGFSEPLKREDAAVVFWRMIRDGYMNDVYQPEPEPPTDVDRVIFTVEDFAHTEPGERILVTPGVYRVGVVPKDRQYWFAAEGVTLDGNGGPHAFSSVARDVIIDGFEMTNYHPPQQAGVIESTAHKFSNGGWKVRNVHLYNNDEVGVRLAGNDTELTDSLIEDQGRLGFNLQFGRNGYAARLTIARCNSDGRYRWGFEAGGSKCWQTDGLLCEDIESFGHVGPGLWTDKDNINTTYRRNIISDCRDAPGIFHEISFEAVIEDNVIRRCGSSGDWLWDAGVQLSTSDGVEVRGNVIEDCGNGVAVISQNRGRSENLDRPYYGRNCYVHDNTIRRSHYTGAVRADSEFGDIWLSRFENNHYQDCAGFAWRNRWIDWAEWQGYGNDLEGTYG